MNGSIRIGPYVVGFVAGRALPTRPSLTREEWQARLEAEEAQSLKDARFRAQVRVAARRAAAMGMDVQELYANINEAAVDHFEPKGVAHA